MAALATRHHTLLVTAIAATLCAALGSCDRGTQPKTTATQPSGAPATASAGPIRLGVLLSLTGDNANYGKRTLNGIRWATDKVNAAGGVNGRPLELVVEDTRSSPREAVSAFNKLITVDKVRIVVGDIISGTTLAVAPIAERNQVLLFAPGASNPALRDAGDFIFRNWTSDDFDGQCMARYLLKKGIQKIGLIVQTTDYTVGLANALARSFAEGGGTIVAREEFNTNTTDVRTQLTKLSATAVTDAYVSAYSAETGLVLKQARELGFAPHWYASLTVDTPECAAVAGDARNGVVFTTPAFSADADTPEVKTFVQGFRERFADEPEAAAGHGYDAINILVSVLRRVGDDPRKVKDALYKVAKFPGVTGITTFDAHGDVIKGINIKVIRDGAPVLLEYFEP